jgi:membrane-bound lytic murein transglycosylase D
MKMDRSRFFLLVAVVFLAVSACVPRFASLPEETYSDLPHAAENVPSLFTVSELEEMSTESVPSQASAPARPVTEQGAPAAKLDLPISDESNDDFNLELLPGEPKRGPDFDIPIVVNAKVEQFIQFFQTTLRNRFATWLARSERYIPIMRNLLKENGLPEDLVYLALIESGFSPYAYSRSKASGPWQFIYFTGKRYGLNVNWWVDERRDPEKSTVAAAKYLKALYDMFACWYLAAAGYNAGEQRIITAIRRYQTEDFWELSKYSYLKQETRDYVPQMIAAALIAKDPERYGFTSIEYQEPLRYDKVHVPELTDLAAAARACDSSVDEIKDLNPELLRPYTPPQIARYPLKIPFGKREAFVRNFEALGSERQVKFLQHKIKKRETLPRIAALYRIEMDPILEINHWTRVPKLTAGASLVVPVLHADRKALSSGDAKAERDAGNTNAPPEEVLYTIKKGDTLWSIANETGVNLGALSRWNHLHSDKKLNPGDKLKIRATPRPRSSDQPPEADKKRKEIVHVVKGGETLWAIAKKYNVAVSEIKNWNGLDETGRIHPSDRLKVKIASVRSSALN